MHTHFVLSTNGTNIFVKEIHKTFHSWNVRLLVGWFFSLSALPFIGGWLVFIWVPLSGISAVALIFFLKRLLGKCLGIVCIDIMIFTVCWQTGLFFHMCFHLRFRFKECSPDSNCFIKFWITVPTCNQFLSVCYCPPVSLTFMTIERNLFELVRTMRK